MTTAPETTRYIVPRVNVKESDESVLIEAELPGVDKNNLALEMKDGELALIGKRSNGNGDGRYVMRERADADFRRVFALSNAIDPTRVEAELKDGLLRITLHKTERVKPRKIVIN